MTKKNGLLDFNLNSILVLAAGALVTWLMNDSLSAMKSTKESVTKIEVTLPYITKTQDRIETDVKDVKNDIKDVKEKAVTRTELDAKHKRILDEIKDVKDEQTKVKEKLDKTNLATSPAPSATTR